MATKKNTSVNMRLHVATGEDASGDLIWANRTIKYINPAIADADFCSIAGGLSQLIDDTLGSAFKDTSEEWELD